MKKDGTTGRTICTRSSALSSASTERETTPALSLRRSTRGTQPTSVKPTTPTSGTRRSERLASSPVSITKNSAKMEKKPTACPLRRSYKVSSQNPKGSSDNPCRNANTSSSDVEESKGKAIDNIEESIDEMKNQEPKMTGRSYRALYRGHLKKESNATSNDDELVVVGCSRRVPAGNDDTRDDNSSPHATSELKGLPLGQTCLEKAPDFPVKVTKDTENMGLDSSSPMVESGDDSVTGSPSENPETQKLRDNTTSLETDIDLPLKRKRDTAEIVVDACANADDRIMSSDGVIPSPSGCTNNNQPERCGTCQKRQKVNDDFENLSVCSCIAPPVQESDHVAQGMKESGPATSRDYGKNSQNMQRDKSYDRKLLSMYPEYWVPVQLSDVQVELYCRTLFSKSLSLSSLSKNDLVGALEETLTSVRKTCDHPYVIDASLKQLLTKNLELLEILDVEVKASGKLHLLDAMLTQIKAKGLKAVVFYQETKIPEGLLVANILDDFVSDTFGRDSYEHGVCHSKKSAINNFNKESQCFILLLETRACSQSIKLLRADVFILFGSSLNPSHDVKLLEKIKIDSSSERTKLFRLYSVCTVEEKALILARQNKPLENLNRPLIHALLMWGASYLFDKLDHFHGTGTPDSGVPSEQPIKDAVIHEFSSILSSNVGEENEGKLSLVVEAKHAQGIYSTDATLVGEEHVKLSDQISPNVFWAKLLGGKNPMWKYCSDTQRSRKRVRHLQISEETTKVDNGGNIKLKKKASDDVTVDNDERKVTGKDDMGDLESSKVTTLKSSRGSASGTNDSLNGNDATGFYSMGGHISRIPEDMLAGIDWRKTPCESQRSLFAVLKPEMAKLCLSEDSASLAEKFLEYIIENHRVCKEPATTLQAFQIALSWIAASCVKQKCNREESLVRAKSELGFNCSKEEVDYIYSFLYCMKSLFLGRTQGLQLDCLGTKKVNESLSGDTVRQNNNTKLMRNSDGEESMTEKRGSHNSSVAKDVEKTISDIKKKCSKKLQKLVQTHEEKKLDLMKRNADKKQKIQTWKKVEVSYIRVTCSGLSTQSLLDNLTRVEDDFERKIDDLKRETDECLKKLEQMHESAKKKLAEDEACWISRIENWAQAELITCAPIQSVNNKHLSGLCSSNTSKNAPDVQTCNDASGEATYADTNCMVAKENQAPETENTLRTLSGGSSQQVHEMVDSRNDKAINVSTFSHEQPTDNVATKSRPNEHASLTAPEILIPAGCQEEFAHLNVQLSGKICDRVTSATPDKDVSSRVPEISQSFANLAKSASLESSLSGEETLVLMESERTNHAVSDADNILDYPNGEACSLDKEIPDELVLPMLQPASVIKTRGSTESEQDDHEICPMPSSPDGKQPDPAANTRGKSIEVAIEPEPAESPMPSSPGGKQPGPAANTHGKSIEAAIEPEPAESPMPSSPAGQQPDPATNIQGKNIDTAIEFRPAGSPMPSSLAGQQPDPAEKIQGKNIEAAFESQPAVQGDQVARPLLSSPAGNQPDSGANMESQNISTSAEPHISDQETMVAQDACSLPPLLIGTPADLAANNFKTVARDASPPPGNQSDPAVSTEGLNNNTTMAAPHTTDACEMEASEPDAQVEQSTFANNVAPRVHAGVVEHSAGVTAPVPSHLNNATGQSAIQPVPQIPFPVFSDPFQHELEKLRRESENTKKTYEEKKSVLKAEFDRKMAELQAEYQRKYHEVEAEHRTKATKIETSKNLVIMNKLLASAFLSKCTSRMAPHRSAAPRGRIQQLAQRAAQVNAQRNYYTASVPALQPQASSFPSLVSRSACLPPDSTHCPMPQPRQPLFSNTAPSLSASPASATNLAVNARLVSPAPHRNHPYRSSSSSIPIPTTSPASSDVPQALIYSTALIQQQEQQHQQQQNLGSGFQGSNDVVCLSDDE